MPDTPPLPHSVGVLRNGRKASMKAMLSLAALCLLLIGCEPTIKDAQDAEGKQHVSEAYQKYASILFVKASAFKVTPAPKRFRSAKELSEWIADVLADYIAFKVTMPTSEDCQIATQKLPVLQKELKYQEHSFDPGSSEPLSLEELANRMTSEFADQNTVPPDALEAVAKAYKSNLSILSIEGDHSGVLYNHDARIATSFRIEHEDFSNTNVPIFPGRWILVSKVVIEKSNPKDKHYREIRDIKGRYSTFIVDIPATPHIMKFKYCLHGD